MGQQALTNGGRTLEVVPTLPSGGTALLRDGSGTLNRKQEHLRDAVGRPGMRSHKPWSMGIANVGSPNMDQGLMDDTQDPTKINDQIDRNKTASNWTNMKEMKAVHRHTPGASVDLSAQMRHLHREIAMKEAMGAVMPMPELTDEETGGSLIQTNG